MYTSNHVSFSLTTSNSQCLSLLPVSLWLGTQCTLEITVGYDDVYLKTGHTDCPVRVFLYPLTDFHLRERHSTVCSKSEMWPLITSLDVTCWDKPTTTVPSSLEMLELWKTQSRLLI